jgi:hypothetical protein
VYLIVLHVLPVLPVLLLSQAGHVTLEGVLSYISPSADSMAAAYKANLETLTEDVRDLGLVKLGDGKDGKDGKEAPAAAAAVVGGRTALLASENELLFKGFEVVCIVRACASCVHRAWVNADNFILVVSFLQPAVMAAALHPPPIGIIR